MQTSTGLVLTGVRKAFRSLVAVDDLTFTVPAGSMFGLLGANGAGKTTTLRMVLNILTPDAGTITWQGVDVAKVPRYTFGYLPEERGLYPKMKTGDQLIFLAGLNDVPTDVASRRARDWPATVLASSTHDTKRSEDVRARINVLSELPREWRAALTRWTRLNGRKKTRLSFSIEPKHGNAPILGIRIWDLARNKFPIWRNNRMSPFVWTDLNSVPAADSTSYISGERSLFTMCTQSICHWAKSPVRHHTRTQM